MATQMEGRRQPSTRVHMSQSLWIQSLIYTVCLMQLMNMVWKKMPTGVMSFASSSFVPNHKAVVGCKKPCHGTAGGCAISSENPWRCGVSGVTPYGIERELSNIIAAPGKNRGVNEGSGGDDLVDTD
eukprot:1571192-Pyramimonas_sp.AAC.1